MRIFYCVVVEVEAVVVVVLTLFCMAEDVPVDTGVFTVVTVTADV